MNEKSISLGNRLIDFAAYLISISEALPKSMAGNYLSSQLLRSSTAPALVYGEAQGAESRSDFIHKMKVALKEFRETNNCLRIIIKLGWKENECNKALEELNQLISIFVTSIKTAQKNNLNNKNYRTPKTGNDPNL